MDITSSFDLIIVFYVLNYFVSPIFSSVDFWQGQNAKTFIYAYVYIITFYITYLVIRRKTNSHGPLILSDNNLREIRFFGTVSAQLLFLVFLYKFTNPEVYIFGNSNIGLVSLGALAIQKVVLFPTLVISTFLIFSENRKKIPILFVVLFLFTLIDSFISTGKGQLIFAILSLLIGFKFAGKKVSLFWKITGACGVAAFFIYSYAARFDGLIYATSFQERLYILQSGGFLDRLDDNLELYINNSFERLELYNNLERYMSRESQVYEGMFSLGSLVELLNYIPDSLKGSASHYSYPVFVQSEMLGYKQLGTSMFIGRMGEGYQVLGFFGIVMGVFYGLIFALHQRLMKGFVSAQRFILYIYLYFLYFIHDSHLTQAFSAIILFAVYFFTLSVVYNVLSKYPVNRGLRL